MTKNVGIYGTNPAGEPNRIYALYCPMGREQEYIEIAEANGWSNLQAGVQPQPALWDEEVDGPTPKPSASLARARSRTTSRRVSSTSGDASH